MTNRYSLWKNEFTIETEIATRTAIGAVSAIERADTNRADLVAMNYKGHITIRYSKLTKATAIKL